jgi:tetratricopeptide (TPR) repeat protein
MAEVVSPATRRRLNLPRPSEPMKPFLAVAVALVTIIAAVATQAPPPSREDAYRANNRGVAYLEQYNHAEAVKEFERALALDPSLALARINLAIAQFYVPDLAAALETAKAAQSTSPDAPQPPYILGLIAKSENRTDDAVEAFKRVLTLDTADLGARVNLAQLLMQRRDYAGAVDLLRPAVASEPYHVTALYNLGVALTRAGKTDEGQKAMAEFQKLREGGYGTTFSNNYLEQGRYAEAVASTGAEAELVDRTTPEVKFVSRATLPRAAADPARNPDPALTRALADQGDGITLVDLDADGDLDLIDVTAFTLRAFTNDKGAFTDATAKLTIPQVAPKGAPIAAIAADFDNDTRVDLFVVGVGAHALLRQTDRGTFEDVTAAAKIPSTPGVHRSAAFADVDHDGDVDLVLAATAGSASHVLLRNNGDGSFTDASAESLIKDAPAGAVALVPTDYDNRRDVDLLLTGAGAAPRAPSLLKNLRDGTFKDVSADVGLRAAGVWWSVAAGDVNKDGFTDFYFGGADRGMLASSDGRGRFREEPGPDVKGVFASQFVDVDNDGLLDLVAMSASGPLTLWRNAGREWVDLSPTALAGIPSVSDHPRQGTFASGDVDLDGDTDLVVKDRSGEIRILANEGGNRHGSLTVRLAGRASNRSGVGSKIELRAGSLRQKLETSSAWPAAAPADILFGLGSRPGADVVRVLWPAGILQAEIPAAQRSSPAAQPPSRPAAQILSLTELDRKPSSCPYLFTWNGERFQFITDFMGGGEMGYAHGPGLWNVPDPEEYTRIPRDALQARNGQLALRVTNELEEALFIDRLALVAVDHPADVEVHPREGLVSPPFPASELVAAETVRPVRRVIAGDGRDVTDRVRDLDRLHVDGLPVQAIRGYAKPHALTIDLGSIDSASGVLLLLTGWTDYAFSSDNVAAGQAGLELTPPALQSRTPGADWVTILPEIGIPIGRPQTVVVDLAGKLPPGASEVRLLTSMRIYWDQIRVATRSAAIPRVTRLEAVGADLRWRGYSAEVLPGGSEPFGYDYHRVSPHSPWKVLPGRYTREGPVGELLQAIDDLFVVSRTGDELALSFDARTLPLLQTGWSRTFLLYSVGYSKEMDRNSASPDQVAPLPFRGMTRYPYSAPEKYPDTPKHRAYQERWNARVVGREIPPIELSAAAGR